MPGQRERESSDGRRDGRELPADVRNELLRRLRAAGRGEEALDRARAEGRLATLGVELALGGVPEHTLTHVARSARLDTRFMRQVMQAAGRPTSAPRERAYTEEDVELARLIRQFLDAGLPRSGVLEISRVLGQGMSQTADAVRRLIGDLLLRPGDSELTLGLRAAQAAEELGPLMGPLLEYEFRAHVREGIRSELVSEAERQEGRLAGARDVAVAFADLVDYTRLGEKLPPEDVGSIARRLAELAGSATKRPAQLVKTIGDAAMLVSPEVAPLLAAIVALVKGVKDEGGDFPALRVGVAYGPATPQGGDWFGATVNLASRVTDAARPGRILVTEAVHDQGAGEYEWKRRRRRRLKGVDGRPRLFSLELDGG